jgi:hypothetical protein
MRDERFGMTEIQSLPHAGQFLGTRIREGSTSSIAQVAASEAAVARVYNGATKSGLLTLHVEYHICDPERDRHVTFLVKMNQNARPKKRSHKLLSS